MVTIPVETAEAGQIEEGDLLTVKINLVTPKPKPKSIRIKDKEIKPKYEIPQELREAVKEALPLMFGEHLQIWVSATEILDTIKYNNLCDLDKLESRNIYIDIGDIMASFGFIESKKISGIKHRLITLDRVKGIKNPGEIISFKLTPPKHDKTGD